MVLILFLYGFESLFELKLLSVHVKPILLNVIQITAVLIVILLHGLLLIRSHLDFRSFLIFGLAFVGLFVIIVEAFKVKRVIV